MTICPNAIAGYCATQPWSNLSGWLNARTQNCSWVIQLAARLRSPVTGRQSSLSSRPRWSLRGQDRLRPVSRRRRHNRPCARANGSAWWSPSTTRLPGGQRLPGADPRRDREGSPATGAVCYVFAVCKTLEGASNGEEIGKTREARSHFIGAIGAKGRYQKTADATVVRRRSRSPKSPDVGAPATSKKGYKAQQRASQAARGQIEASVG